MYLVEYIYICSTKWFFSLIIKKDGGKGPVMS
jgi:hypothetical protein